MSSPKGGRLAQILAQNYSSVTMQILQRDQGEG